MKKHTNKEKAKYYMEKAMKAFNNKEYKKSIKYSNRAEIFLKKEAKEIEKGSSK